MIIRDCIEQDFSSIQEIENASFEDPYPSSLFLSFFASNPQGFRVAAIRNLLIGYSIVSIGRSKALIASLAVRPGYRGKGVGSRLLEDAISLCKERFKASNIELQVRSDNREAISLYTRFGFTNKGTMKGYYGKGKDGLLMKLE